MKEIRRLVIGQVALAIAIILFGAQSALAAISTGTGFFITADGVLLTSFHVVEGAKKIVLKDYKGQEYPAEISAVDRSNDLALLQVRGKFAALPIIDSKDVKRGASVITLGFPHIDIQGFQVLWSRGFIQ